MHPTPHEARFEETAVPQHEDVEIPVEPFKGTPEEIERQWFEQLYLKRGAKMRQLTWRAVLMGSALGAILSLTNIYVGLKAGWGLGISITACILSYAIWTALCRIGISRSPMTILENNCMQSTATAAGSSTGCTLISAFSAYMMIYGHSLPVEQLLGWVFFLAVLGVTMAIPMKRQMINVDQLRFPSGIATAETLRALHSHGEKGIRSAIALAIAGGVGVVNKFWTDGLHLLHSTWEKAELGTIIGTLNEKIFGKVWMARTVQFEWDPIFIAAGAISGMRVCLSMMVGATLCWAVYVPIMQQNGVITGSSYREIVQWTLWGGVSCMVFSGLFSFALQWRSFIRAISGLTRMFRSTPREMDEMEKIETPFTWFLAGQLFGLIGLSYLGHVTFGMPIWQTTLAVFMSFFLALVACRVTGETDTTPVGAMGKVTQVMFGAVSPGKMDINLFSANITAASANASADLLTDLKSGYLLGANPRKQFLAQFSGIFIGTVVTVFCFRIMVPDPSVLGGNQFPAPAAQAWKAVAIALSKGLEALEKPKVWSIIIGGAIGIILPLIAKLFPKTEKHLPSAAGLGLAWTFHWYYSLLFFLGALIAWGWNKGKPKQAEEFMFPVASGIIAGGSLMGVIMVFWENGPQMLRTLLHH
jgi:putative OPT family oligopeptide transporter